MPAWIPLLIMPNLDMQDAIECEAAAIVGRTHEHVQTIIAEHPNFGLFLSKFHGQFGEEVHPAILMVKADAGTSYFTAEAVSAFRNLVALSVVPLARARRLNYLRAQPLAFSNVFEFYPWMMDKDYDKLVCLTPAVWGIHLLSEFSGQSYPEQSQTSLMESDIDKPLVVELMSRWHKRFSDSGGDRHARALFRSLNMANETARMPGNTAVTFHEFGRSLALWVSSFEILTHPDGEGEANINTVFAALDEVEWEDKVLGEAKYQTGKRRTMRTLACHVYERVHSLRNDFLHGNDVDASHLVVGKEERQMIDYAAALYRLALTGALPITFRKDIPSLTEPVKCGHYIADLVTFESPQREYEKALGTFLLD